MEERRFTLHTGPTDVRQLVRTLAHQMLPWAAASGVTLTTDVARAVPHSLMLDGPKLSQSLANFCSNALKFVPQDGTGRVSLAVRTVVQPPSPIHAESLADEAAGIPPSRAASSSPDDDSGAHRVGGVPTRFLLRCEVTDNGVGIAPEESAKLFNPYQQVNSGVNAKQVVGTGLGLAITKEVVAQHGGTVGVISDLGRGSTFWLQVPMKRCRPGARLSSDSLASALSSGSVSSSEEAPLSGAGGGAMLTTESGGTLRLALPLRRSPSPGSPPNDVTDPSLRRSRVAPGPVPRVAFDPSGSNREHWPLRVLIVEDDRATVKLMERLFNRIYGCTGSDRGSRAESRCESVAASGAGGGDGAADTGATPQRRPSALLARRRRSSAETDSPDADGASVIPDVESPRRVRTPAAARGSGTIVVQTACNGAEALQLLSGLSESQLPHIITLDGRMPVLDGYDCARAVRALEAEEGWPRLVLIGCTGNALEEDQSAFIGAGVDAVLTKPLSAADLQATVELLMPALAGM